MPSPVGPPDATLAAAVARLSAHGCITACSSLYSTTPVGIADQPRFLNAAVALEASLGPHTLLKSLLAIERALGRDRTASIPNGPRTLDLDLLLYGDLILNEHDLELPHPRFAQRAFVLVPLNEIAPALHDPRSGRTVAELLQALRNPPSSAPVDDIAAVVPIESAGWHARLSGSAARGGQ